MIMPLLDYIIWHKWLNPVSHVSSILDYNFSLTFSLLPADNLSRPWEWIFNIGVLTYSTDPLHLAMISPDLMILIIPAMLFVLYKSLKDINNSPALFAGLWFIGTYLLWIPASLITDRLSYFYYFYPAVCSICVAVTYGISTLASRFYNDKKKKKIISAVISVFILLHLGVFVLLSPANYWLKLILCIAAYFLASIVMSKEKDEYRHELSTTV
jgi:predicted membrane-bound dolichyl-phosphate-mannose-protein mannosyltransferase